VFRLLTFSYALFQRSVRWIRNETSLAWRLKTSDWSPVASERISHLRGRALRSPRSMDLGTVKKKMAGSFETSTTTRPVTKRHIYVTWNPFALFFLVTVSDVSQDASAIIVTDGPLNCARVFSSAAVCTPNPSPAASVCPFPLESLTGTDGMYTRSCNGHAVCRSQTAVLSSNAASCIDIYIDNRLVNFGQAWLTVCPLSPPSPHRKLLAGERGRTVSHSYP
jgi:hypothetical protein